MGLKKPIFPPGKNRGLPSTMPPFYFLTPIRIDGGIGNLIEQQKQLTRRLFF